MPSRVLYIRDVSAFISSGVAVWPHSEHLRVVSLDISMVAMFYIVSKRLVNSSYVIGRAALSGASSRML